jgi:hypothetical protein
MKVLRLNESQLEELEEWIDRGVINIKIINNDGKEIKQLCLGILGVREKGMFEDDDENIEVEKNKKRKFNDADEETRKRSKTEKENNRGDVIEISDDESEGSESEGSIIKEENDNGKKHTKAFEELNKELSTLVNQEWMNNLEDEMEESLSQLVLKVIEEDQNQVKIYYMLGKKFREEIKVRTNGKKKERKVKGEIYNELMNEIKVTSREALKKKLERAERVNKLFEGIGENKIEQLIDCGVTTIARCRVEEINKLIELHKNK